MTMLSFKNDLNSVNIIAIPNVLTKEECEIIIDYASKQKKLKAKIGGNLLNTEYRSNEIVWLSLSRDHSLNWLFKKIAKNIIEVNEKIYNFHIVGLTEDLQFTEYSKIDDHYDWHTDCGGSNVRKISVSLQLSDPKDYEGCELEFAHLKMEDEISKKNRKEQGTMVIFPSYLAHRITSLKSGKRYSLVVWVGGDNFK